jgi:hypothetical protein
MTPLVLFTVAVILIATPLSIGASVFCWQLYREARAEGAPGLSLVLAIVITATTIAGVLLAIPTLLFVLGSPVRASELVLVAIDILLPSPVVIAGYLRWLRR